MGRGSRQVFAGVDATGLDAAGTCKSASVRALLSSILISRYQPLNRSRFFLHAALKPLWPSREASRASFSVMLSRCRRSLLGLPHGASIRCRLLLGLLISAARPSNPMVAVFIGCQCEYAAEAQSEWSFRTMKGKISIMKLAKSNRFLRSPGQAKAALWVSAKTSSAIEGIRHPFGPHAWQPPTAQALIDYWKKHASKSGR